MTDQEMASALAKVLSGVRPTSRFALESFLRAVASDGVVGAELSVTYEAGEPIEISSTVGMNGR